jgi:hypothetical protein
MEIVNTKRLVPLTAVVASFLVTPTVFPQARYDVAKEFSATNNPTGVWTYGYSSGRLDGFVAFATTDGAAFRSFSGNPQVTVTAWGRNLPFPANHPLVMKNQSQIDLTKNNNSDIVLAAGNLAVSSGEKPNPTYGIVRFTSPADNLYSVQAIFSGIQFSVAGTTTDVHVLVNGSPIFDAVINGFGEIRSYASRMLIRLSAGATVDFAVGPGSNGNQNSDWTGLAAVITAGAQPNPALLSVLTTERLRFSPIQGFRISLVPPATGAFRIETSTDLKNWASFLSFQTSSGPFEFIDSTAVSFTNRFYRVVKP